MKNVLLLGISLLFLFSCRDKNKPQPPNLPEEFRGIFVLNEGQWTYNNASLTFYDGNQARQNVFREVNNESLGDVANSVFLDKDTLYIIVNNSKILYKLQMPQLKLLKKLTFPQSASPRTMVKTAPDQAYVNSMLDNSVYIVNLSEMTISGKITIENFSEDMIKLGDKVYVSCGNYAYPQKNNKIAKIDIATNSVEGYLTLPLENPGDLEIIDDTTFSVVCRGNYQTPKKSMLCFVNTKTFSVADSLVFNAYSFDGFVRDSLMFLINDEGISRINLRNKTVTMNFISKQDLGMQTNDLLYAFYYDSFSDKYYVVNAKYGGTNGVCYVLDNNFVKTKEFETGVFGGTIFSYR